MPDAARDKNYVTTLLAVSSVDNATPVRLWADPTTHRLLTDSNAAISASMQTDVFSATNGQTTFIPSQTVAYTFYLSINGAIQTPSTDYSLIGGQYVLNSGIPQGSVVIALYSIT